MFFDSGIENYLRIFGIVAVIIVKVDLRDKFSLVMWDTEGGGTNTYVSETFVP